MNSTTHRIVRIIALALLAHYALCWPLWLESAGRSFPTLPVCSFFESLPTWLLSIQAGLLVLLTTAVFIFPQKKVLVATMVLLWAFLVAQDMSRLQPWLYFYGLAFLIILMAHRHPEAAIWGLQWLLAAVYAWSGFNKISPYFAVDNFPWFCEAFVWTKPLGAVPALGYAIALAELLFAIGLLWQASRPVFRWLVPGFHLFIALALSPIGLDWNAVVIPWNLAMAALVIMLFGSENLKIHLVPKMLKQPVWALLAIPLCLAWIMPVFNIFHLWDEALSWKMYSNTQTEASFYYQSKPEEPTLKAVWEHHAYDKGTTILLDDWAMKNLHVPAYNSRRTHLQIARYLCGYSSNSAKSGLLLLKVERWDRSAERWEQISCTSIKPKVNFRK